MKSFLDYYDFIRSSDDAEFFYTRNPEGKVCRFCSKSYPAVSFDTFPHLIPELFGRNKTASNFECDECNKNFQKFETDISTMIQHYLSLLNMKTKRGVPDFQSKKDKNSYSTTIKSGENGSIINFGRNLNDFKYDYDNNSLTANFRTRRFIPFFVYKVFLKMGIALLSEKEIQVNSHYLEFLNAPEPIMNGMQIWNGFRYMLKTKYHMTPKVNLYQAKKTLIEKAEYPEYVLLINFANVLFQFFLPISAKNIAEHKREHELKMELFPAIALEDFGKVRTLDYYILDLSETKKVSITDTIVFHYEKLVSKTEPITKYDKEK